MVVVSNSSQIALFKDRSTLVLCTRVKDIDRGMKLFSGTLWGYEIVRGCFYWVQKSFA